MAEDVHVGAGTVINPGVVLYPGTVVGEHCLIHANVVLGADGFGFVPPPTKTLPIGPKFPTSALCGLAIT